MTSKYFTRFKNVYPLESFQILQNFLPNIFIYPKISRLSNVRNFPIIDENV